MKIFGAAFKAKLTFLTLSLTGCPINVAVNLPAGLDTTDAPASSDDSGEVPTTGLEPTTGAASTTTTDGSGGATGSGGPEPAPACGNGEIEGDEMCDDGLGNGPQDLCTDTCEHAVCGDGLLQPDNGEQCDDGDMNVAEPGYQQCSTGCSLSGGYCGDGVVQLDAGEECEASQEPESLKNCPGMCRLAPRIVFLTSDSFTGAMGGLAGADKRCNEFAAASPTLTGTFRAWLLVDGQSLADRFPEFVEPVAWSFTSTAAEPLAKSFAELVEKGPASPILYTETGEAVPEQRVWTGITGAGQAAGGDCDQWTGTDGAALVGHSGFVPDLGPEALKWHVERQWTDLLGSKLPCTQSYPIYCIQVAD